LQKLLWRIQALVIVIVVVIVDAGFAGGIVIVNRLRRIS